MLGGSSPQRGCRPPGAHRLRLHHLPHLRLVVNRCTSLQVLLMAFVVSTLFWRQVRSRRRAQCDVPLRSCLAPAAVQTTWPLPPSPHAHAGQE